MAIEDDPAGEPEPRFRYQVWCELEPDLAGKFEALRFLMYRTGVQKSILTREAVIRMIEAYERRYGPIKPRDPAVGKWSESRRRRDDERKARMVARKLGGRS